MKTTENLLKIIWELGRHLEMKLAMVGQKNEKISTKAEKLQIKCQVPNIHLK